MCVNYIGGREMLVMYVSNKISASVILFSYIHFQKAGSPLVQQYGSIWKTQRSDFFARKPCNRGLHFFPYYHKKWLMSWCPLEVHSLISLQALGMAEEMHGSHSADFPIGVEIFWVRIHGHKDNYTERMTMSVHSYFKTLCSILTSLLCLPQAMGVEFSASSWLPAWALTAALAGHPVQRGKMVCKGTKSGPCIISRDLINSWKWRTFLLVQQDIG